jgi:hypothetical protein
LTTLVLLLSLRRKVSPEAAAVQLLDTDSLSNWDRWNGRLTETPKFQQTVISSPKTPRNTSTETRQTFVRLNEIRKEFTFDLHLQIGCAYEECL